MRTMRLTLYTKPDCHLCDLLKQDLADLQPEFDFRLTECNILDDRQLFEQFQYLIPVLEIDGDSLHYPPHDWVTLHDALRKAQQRYRAENA